MSGIVTHGGGAGKAARKAARNEKPALNDLIIIQGECDFTVRRNRVCPRATLANRPAKLMRKSELPVCVHAQRRYGSGGKRGAYGNSLANQLIHPEGSLVS